MAVFFLEVVYLQRKPTFRCRTIDHVDVR